MTTNYTVAEMFEEFQRESLFKRPGNIQNLFSIVKQFRKELVHTTKVAT